MTFEVNEATHLTYALLSLYILVLAYYYGIPMSLVKCFSDWSYMVHLLVAVILASH